MSYLWSFWRVLALLLCVPLCHGTPLSPGFLLQSGTVFSKSLPTTTQKTKGASLLFPACQIVAVQKFDVFQFTSSNIFSLRHAAKLKLGFLLESGVAFAKSLPISAGKTKTNTMKKETAILAGGCFWGVEDLLRKIPGVLTTEVGYTGGNTEAPVYTLVKTGTSGHAEAVKIDFDSSKITFEQVLEHFFKLHDPTTKNQQGNDIGTQYRSAIFYTDEKQKEEALHMIDRVNKSGVWKKPLVTEVVAFKKFYPAEEYHQDYLIKNPGGYTCHYYRDVKF